MQIHYPSWQLAAVLIIGILLIIGTAKVKDVKDGVIEIVNAAACK